MTTQNRQKSNAKQINTEISTDMMKKNRRNDVISILRRSYVSLNGYTWSYRGHEHALVRSVMIIFAIFNITLYVVAN